ncbi:MAG: hypothetical protein LBN08_07860 [Lactobacillales bacterium]|jgi:hypothetical protein|nr:hypothetical protein [Lactobacillales bacterium]
MGKYYRNGMISVKGITFRAAELVSFSKVKTYNTEQSLWEVLTSDGYSKTHSTVYITIGIKSRTRDLDVILPNNEADALMKDLRQAMRG